MTAAGATEFYQQTYQETNEPEGFFSSQQGLEVGRYIRPYLEGVGSILDYGCGPGGKILSLASDGFDVYGMDLNPSFLDYAVSKGIKRWVDDMQYDCIFLSHTLEHWIHPQQDLGQLVKRNLRPGGLLIIEVPLVDRLVLGYRREGFRGETHLAHAWYFSTRTLAAMVETLGFKLEVSDGVTTCIFRHDPAHKVTGITSRPYTEYLRVAIIEASRIEIVRRILLRLNRSLNFVDLEFRQRMAQGATDARLTNDQ